MKGDLHDFLKLTYNKIETYMIFLNSLLTKFNFWHIGSLARLDFWHKHMCNAKWA